MVMVRVLDHVKSMQKSKSFHLKRIFEIPSNRQNHNPILEGNGDHNQGSFCALDESRGFRSVGSGERDLSSERGRVGWALDCGTETVSGLEGIEAGPMPSPLKKAPSDVELMKERFAKLLLGEDMSGGGKGVSSALALSNAITNLAASVFGEQRKLEPMQPERKARWRKEIDWLLSVTDHIVEFVPSQQVSKDGTNMEIMVTRQRADLLMNIPALRKLDAMLLGHLDNFGGQNEFWYGSKDDNDSEDQRKDDRWWMPTVKVPPNGLSDASRKWMLLQKESVNQVLKAAMAINAQVLSEMAIPEDYIESLPKNGRASLGDSIYKSITVEYFDPEEFLSTMDLSTEHKVLDLKNRIEASIIIWMRKMNSKEVKSPWGSAVSLEKRELFEERAETILLLLKQQFPGIPQSALDISKIQCNRDVGQSVLESYSRVIKSLAYNVLSRIEDVLEADALAQDPSAEPRSSVTDTSPPAKTPESNIDEEPESLHYSTETPTSMTLSDFMGWSLDNKESKVIRNKSVDNLHSFAADEGDKTNSTANKSSHNITNKISLYLEKL